MTSAFVTDNSCSLFLECSSSVPLPGRSLPVCQRQSSGTTGSRNPSLIPSGWTKSLCVDIYCCEHPEKGFAYHIERTYVLPHAYLLILPLTRKLLKVNNSVPLSLCLQCLVMHKAELTVSKCLFLTKLNYNDRRKVLHVFLVFMAF